jgi:RNA polymerase sigma-70 factor (ECF subfamily)
MDADARAALERELTELHRRGDYEAAATRAVRGYGPELLGFLHAILHDADRAGEVFSQLCEDLWRGLPGFAARASFRTWLYTLARHAAWRRLKREQQARRELPLDDCSMVSRVEQEVRAATLPHLRTETRDRLVELRESLPVEDQAVLILRIDRKLDWNDLARVLHEGETLDDAALKRESARLRKRFQLLKERLRERARAEGLLASE